MTHLHAPDTDPNLILRGLLLDGANDLRPDVPVQQAEVAARLCAVRKHTVGPAKDKESMGEELSWREGAYFLGTAGMTGSLMFISPCLLGRKHQQRLAVPLLKGFELRLNHLREFARGLNVIEIYI